MPENKQNKLAYTQIQEGGRMSQNASSEILKHEYQIHFENVSPYFFVLLFELKLSY